MTRNRHLSRSDRPVLGLIAVLIVAWAILVIPSFAKAAGPAPIDGDPITATPVPGELEGLLGDMPSAGAEGLLEASSGAADRRGLGLPSYKEILGRKWKQLAAKADDEFATGLDDSEAAPTRTGGSARIGAGEFDRMFKMSDQVKGKGGKQTRKLKVAATLSGGCPQLSTLGGHYGWDASARATYEVTTTERVGRYDVVTAVVLDGHFETRPSMLNDATADAFSSADNGEIAITRNQVAIDRKTGKRSKIGETERFTSTIDPFYKPEGSFEAFVAAQDDEAPAPPRPLRSSVWEDAATWFLTIPYDAVRSRVEDAAKLARTPNRCVTMSFPDAPSHLAPSQSVNLTGIPKLTGDPAMNPFYVLQSTSSIKAGWINMQGQSAAALGNIHQLWGGKPWYSFTAPAAAWPANKRVGLDFTLTSGAGVATAPVSFAPEDPTVHYEILDAGFETHTTASRPSSYCGEVGGSQTYSGTNEPTEFTTEDQLTIEDGDVAGEVAGTVRAGWTDHYVYGCKAHGASCSAHMPDRQYGVDGIRNLYVSFGNGPDPSKVRLDWSLDDPEVGFVDAGDDECNSHVWGAMDLEDGRTTVSRSELQGTGPIHLVLAGSKHLSEDGYGDPASIDYDWSYEITIQRVDENGDPIG